MPEVFDAPNWSRHYPETPMPRLSVIMAKPDGFAGFAQKVVGATAATASLSNRLWTADKMPDAQFMTALKIIRAQASTELGSIQQHRMVYEQLDGGSLTGFDKEIVEGIHRTDPTGHRLDAISFSQKRVCVEELRHHMQMAGVLTLDETFDKARWGRHWATETMEELFAMKPASMSSMRSTSSSRASWTPRPSCRSSTASASSSWRCSTISCTGRWPSRCRGCGSSRSRTTSPRGRPS